MRFVKKEDCWLDTKTGMEWELNQSEEKLNQEDAQKYCESLGPDWRLPSRDELLGITDHKKYSPACNLPDTLSSSYWSATTYAGNTDCAWYVNFVNGGVNYYVYKSSALYVRAVRGGQG